MKVKPSCSTTWAARSRCRSPTTNPSTQRPHPNFKCNSNPQRTHQPLFTTWKLRWLLCLPWLIITWPWSIIRRTFIRWLDLLLPLVRLLPLFMLELRLAAFCLSPSSLLLSSYLCRRLPLQAWLWSISYNPCYSPWIISFLLMGIILSFKVRLYCHQDYLGSTIVAGCLSILILTLSYWSFQC